MFFFILEKLVLVQPFTKILLLVTLIYFILFSSLWCSALLSLYAQLGEITHMYEVLSSVVIPKKTSFSTFLSMYFIIYYSLIIYLTTTFSLFLLLFLSSRFIHECANLSSRFIVSFTLGGVAMVLMQKMKIIDFRKIQKVWTLSTPPQIDHQDIIPDHQIRP